jgi:CBS domain containing-hemolysin-like protein
MSDYVSLLIGVGLLLGNGFFVASEFAVLSAKRHRLEEAAADAGPLGRSAARSAVRGVRELSMMLAGAQLGITVCTLGLLTVVEPALAHLLEPVLHAVHAPDWAQHPIAFVIALVVVTFLHMVVGEMAPKSWALTHPERAALVLALPFRGFTVLTRPLLRVLNGFTNWLLHRMRVDARDELSTTRTPGQLAMLVGESGRMGMLDPGEHQLLARALRVQDLPVSRVMVDLERAATVAAEADAEGIMAAARTSGYLRLPVREADGEVIGVLHMRDVVGREVMDRQPVTARAVARPVPRMDAATVLPEAVARLQAGRSHLGLVTSGGEVVGLVSQTDLIGQLLDMNG